MQNFTDAQGRFVFPEQLFPEVSGPRAVPPSVGSRRAAILRGAAAALAFADTAPSGLADSQRGSAHATNDSGSAFDARASAALDWSRSVLDFHGLWSPLPPEMVEQAVKVLRLLADRGNGTAAYVLGATSIVVSAGKPPLVPPNDRRALLRQALKAETHRAWYRVGVNSDSRGDTPSALSRFRRGADRGDSACLYTLGLAYIQGQFGLDVDLERGINLLELAVGTADSDFPRAPYFLGKIMLDETAGLGISGLGAFVQIDKARGLDLVERSAVLGFAPALLRMADAHLGPERGFDCASALRYLSLAACQEIYRRFNGRAPVLGGAPEAQIVKWLLCGYESLVAKNEEWAYKFAEISATDENASALFALAYFHEVGIATAPDMERARALYEMSSARGFPAAQARLEQLDAGKPQLRRTLTRQDHDAKMRKHYAALMRGDAGAPSAAINDESTVASDANAPNGTANAPNGMANAPGTANALNGTANGTSNGAGRTVSTNGTNGAGLTVNTSGTDGAGRAVTNGTDGVNTHKRAQSASIVPRTAPALVPSNLPYPVSPQRPVLPYPTESPPSSPWDSPRSRRSEPSSPRSFSSLPYPSSPPRRSPSPRASSLASYGHASAQHSTDSIQSIPRKPVPLTNASTHSLNSASASTSASNSGPNSAANSGPNSAATSAANSAPNSAPNSAAKSTFGKLPSVAARQGPPLKPVPTDLLQNAPFLKPNTSTDSFTTVAEQPIAPGPPTGPHTGPHTGLGTGPAAGPTPSEDAARFRSRPRSQDPSPPRPQDPSPPRSQDPSPPGSSAASIAPSTAQSTASRRRPLSAQWVRQSFNGANRFFSTTSLANSRSVSPVASGQGSVASAAASTAPTIDDDGKRRSQSPLRKILGSTPEQRAAASRRDRRSFTEAALAELANVPKVPVQPIKKDRVPGVAYTFEEMGVKPVAGDKNDRCVIQ